ncbi:MAG: DUF4263 domain-containing protein [Flavobacterium sp.]|nr:MAG: DUF4263 domain-containing protein [Flavobacterium sp.]
MTFFKTFFSKKKLVSKCHDVSTCDPQIPDVAPVYDIDFIHTCVNSPFSRNVICRVRLKTRGEISYVFLTDIGDKNTGASVTNSVERIIRSLESEKKVPVGSVFIEHYDELWKKPSFDVVTLDERDSPSWKSQSENNIREWVGDEVEELLLPTADDPLMMRKIERARRTSYPDANHPPVWAESCRASKDRVKIFVNALSALINLNPDERTIQTFMKADLSFLGSVYGVKSEEFIAFSEFPVPNGRVDFAVFTGRSRLQVFLIEVKGANFNFANENSYKNINAKANEALQQLRSRIGEIERDVKKFKADVHSIRQKCEDGESIFGSTLGADMPLQVDPNKDIIIRGVVIAGRTVNDLEESRLRNDYEASSNHRVNIETWDTFIRRWKPRH